jgi:hypothetical protein
MFQHRMIGRTLAESTMGTAPAAEADMRLHKVVKDKGCAPTSYAFVLFVLQAGDEYKKSGMRRPPPPSKH